MAASGGDGPSTSSAPAAPPAADPWTLRLRGPKGTPGEVVLEHGAASTVRDLKRALGKATRIAQKSLVVRRGFPPKPLPLPDAADGDDVRSLGLVDRDLLHVSATSPGEVASSAQQQALPAQQTPQTTPAKRPAFGTPTVGAKKRIDKSGQVREVKRRRRPARMPGAGVRLSDDAPGVPNTEPDDPVGGMDAALSRIGAELAGAARGGCAQLPASVLSSLRTSLREARKQRGAESEAEAKFAAAISGRVRFVDLTDGSGRVRAIWRASHRQKAPAKEECVSGLPLVLLAAVLRHLAKEATTAMAADAEDGGRAVAEACSALRGPRMALASPRVFWGVVRHGGVGPGTSFPMALSHLVPEVSISSVVFRCDSIASIAHPF